MLITKRKPKLKLENDLSKKIAIFYRFHPKLYQALFNNSIAMATVDVPRDWFVFELKAHWYIVKVTMFELPTTYCFSTAEGKTILWVGSAPLACLGLRKVLQKYLVFGRFSSYSVLTNRCILSRSPDKVYSS